MLERSWTQDFVALRNDPRDVSLRKEDFRTTERPCESAGKTIFAVLDLLLLQIVEVSGVIRTFL